jgi:hypothetical protein
MRGIPVQEFARKAPSATPGQSRYPPSTIAANAIPVGGHTAVTLLLVNASASPNLAEPK